MAERLNENFFVRFFLLRGKTFCVRRPKEFVHKRTAPLMVIPEKDGTPWTIKGQSIVLVVNDVATGAIGSYKLTPKRYIFLFCKGRVINLVLIRGHRRFLCRSWIGFSTNHFRQNWFPDIRLFQCHMRNRFCPNPNSHNLNRTIRSKYALIYVSKGETLFRWKWSNFPAVFTIFTSCPN